MMTADKAATMMVVLIKECVQMDTWTLPMESTTNGLVAADAQEDHILMRAANVLVKKPHLNAN